MGVDRSLKKMVPAEGNEGEAVRTDILLKVMHLQPLVKAEGPVIDLAPGLGTVVVSQRRRAVQPGAQHAPRAWDGRRWPDMVVGEAAAGAFCDVVGREAARVHKAALQPVRGARVHQNLGLEAVVPLSLFILVLRLAAACFRAIVVCGISSLLVSREDQNVVGLDGVRRQVEGRAVEVEFDLGAEAGYDGVAVGVPCVETAVGVVGEQLVPLDAPPPLVVAGQDDAPGKARVGEPELVFRDKPVRIVGRVQLAEAGEGIRRGDFLPWHVGLHVGAPKTVLGRVAVQDAARLGDVGEVVRGEIREDAGDELGGEGRQETFSRTCAGLGVCAHTAVSHLTWCCQ
jgi:hypothetical protein